MSTDQHESNINPTHPAVEYSPREFGELIGRSDKWVRATLVKHDLVPYSVVNGRIRLTGRSLQSYMDLRDAGGIDGYSVHK